MEPLAPLDTCCCSSSPIAQRANSDSSPPLCSTDRSGGPARNSRKGKPRAAHKLADEEVHTSLEDVLRQFVSLEVLSGKNQYACAHCTRQRRQQYEVEQLTRQMNQLKLCQPETVSPKPSAFLESMPSSTSTAPLVAPPGGDPAARTTQQLTGNQKSETAGGASAELATGTSATDKASNEADSNDEAEAEAENENENETETAQAQKQQQNSNSGGGGRRKKQRNRGKKVNKKQERKRRKEEHERAKAGNRLSAAPAASEPPLDSGASASSASRGSISSTTGGGGGGGEVDGGSTQSTKAKSVEKEAADATAAKPPGVVYCNAVLKTLVHIPPPVLILHLKRFEQVSYNSVRKLDSFISFPELLDLAPFCDSYTRYLDPVLRESCGESETPHLWYSVYAVVEHSGSLKGGHYVAYVRVAERAPSDSDTDSALRPDVLCVLERCQLLLQEKDLLSLRKLLELYLQHTLQSEMCAQQRRASATPQPQPHPQLQTPARQATPPLTADGDCDRDGDGVVGSAADSTTPSVPEAVTGAQLPSAAPETAAAAAHKSESRWFYVSDSLVQPVTPEKALAAQAYLLFYQRL